MEIGERCVSWCLVAFHCSLGYYHGRGTRFIILLLPMECLHYATNGDVFLALQKGLR